MDTVDNRGQGQGHHDRDRGDLALAPLVEDKVVEANEVVEEEPLDPRVQLELEKLNACTDDINKLETQLEDANALFRQLLSDSTQQLKVCECEFKAVSSLTF